MTERGTDRLGRRAKRFLTPLQKYEIWLQLVRGETTIAEAADRLEVDRSTIMRLRTVAKDGALAALADSKPGVATAKRDVELEAAGRRRPGWARRSRSWPSGCCCWREKGVGAEWPGPAQGGCGHQGRAAGPAGAGLRAGLDGAWGLPGAGGQRAARVPVVGPPRRRRTRGPGAWWQPAAWAAGLGGRRDRAAVRCVGRGRPLPPQARPPRLPPGAGVGVAVQRAPRAGA
jgi:transposase